MPTIVLIDMFLMSMGSVPPITVLGFRRLGPSSLTARRRAATAVDRHRLVCGYFAFPRTGIGLRCTFGRCVRFRLVGLEHFLLVRRQPVGLRHVTRVEMAD